MFIIKAIIKLICYLLSALAFVSGLWGQQVNFIQSKNSAGRASLTSDAYYTIQSRVR